MKAVILAAGKSTRTQPLTLDRPKPLLKVCNKEIIKHSLDNLAGIIDEAIIVVGFKKEMITQALNNVYNDIKITYVEQTEQLGTGHAVSIVKDYIDDNFLLFGADDLFSKEDFLKLSKEQFAILGQEVGNPSEYGVLVPNENGFLYKIVEKPIEFISNIVSTGCYKLTPEIFNHMELTKTKRGEFEFVDALTSLSKAKKVNIVMTKDWIPVTYAWNLLDANEKLIKKIKRNILGTVQDNVTLIGEIIIGQGTVLKSGTYIEGPVIIGKNCNIGPNCFIRTNTSIGDNCHIGQGAEVKNTILGDKSNIPHLNYVGDSVIGNNCNLGAGTISANLRHDNKNIKTMIKGILIDTGRRKLGTIMADNVHTGINTSIYPGRKFWPNTGTKPGQIIDKDVMD